MYGKYFNRTINTKRNNHYHVFNKLILFKATMNIGIYYVVKKKLEMTVYFKKK